MQTINIRKYNRDHRISLPTEPEPAAAVFSAGIDVISLLIDIAAEGKRKLNFTMCRDVDRNAVRPYNRKYAAYIRNVSFANDFLVCRDPHTTDLLARLQIDYALRNDIPLLSVDNTNTLFEILDDHSLNIS